jgi:hypothetical protein
MLLDVFLHIYHQVVAGKLKLRDENLREMHRLGTSLGRRHYTPGARQMILRAWLMNVVEDVLESGNPG